MKISIFTLFLGSLIMASCANEKATGEDPGFYGQNVDEEGAVTVSTAFDALATKDEFETKITGVVGDVCQVKGCWMNLSDGRSDQEFFVQFKDYGFFVPKDLTGSTVVMEGRAYKDLTTVEELRHFAEDEGASEDEIAAITEPKEEYKFEATGVKVVE